LTIDTVSPALLSLHASSRTTSSAFIAASNPESKAIAEADNDDLHRTLSTDLHQRALIYIDAIGKRPSKG
jgi:hypothetical protein